jgi:cobalt-zinc-cadmium efflux system membrane fusion protein
VAFDDRRVSHLYSPVTGRVRQILADPGQRVRRGAPLVVIESPDVGNAFADLDKAQADLVAAEHDYRRQRELYEAHAAAQRDFEAAEDSYGKAKAEVERARQKARLFKSGSADKVTQEFTLRAPIDGEVIARSVNPGTEVQGQYSGGQAVELYTIGELDRVWLLADVAEADLGKVRVGASVLARVVAYPDRVFEGQVDWIAAALDPQTRTARVRCSLTNSDRLLKPEMFATVNIAIAGERRPAVARPAVLRLGDQTVVFIEDGRAADGRRRFVRRVVVLDDDDGGDYLPVKRNLGLGERVVISGAILVSGAV